MLDFARTIAEFGGNPSGLKLLDRPMPELLAYATLIGPTRKTDNRLSMIQAVYEWQGAPLMFLVDSDDLRENPDQSRAIRRLPAMRGDTPYLGVAAPGRLEIHRIALDDQKASNRIRVPYEDDQANQLLLPWLANNRPDADISNQRSISDVVLRLFADALASLIQVDGIEHEDAISLVGRALFTRFLADRSLLPRELGKCADSLFADEASTRKTSEWLDHTFNGDLLSPGDGVFDALGKTGYLVLGNILRRAPGGQFLPEWKENWDRLDFAHIPVGVLSRTYEFYRRTDARQTQKHQGEYCTPQPIADLLVSAAFKASSDGVQCPRVLDPAAGAGVFLLTAFRELVATEWRQTGIRPSTEKLRQILYGQITGFDINEAALRFATPGLYLTALEFDPDPQPVNKRAFPSLRGSVLHLLHDEAGDPSGLGSLGPLASDEHKNQYDMVIGNPPWSRGSKLANWSETYRMVSRIARDRGIEGVPNPLPGKVPDLPFVRRAMEWVKPEGQIAFALHGRLLFQHGEGMPDARQAIFDALDITGIVNGSELCGTKLWPNINAPFCLLLARNRRPTIESAYRFVTPHRESSLDDSGLMRINAAGADPVSNEQLRETPELFRILSRGSTVDLAIIERLRRTDYPTVGAYWRQKIGRATKGGLRGTGNGYQIPGKSSRIRKKGDGKPGVDASYLHGLPDLEIDSLSGILIDASRLPAFKYNRIHDPRQKEIFSGPLLVLHQSVSVDYQRIRTAVSDTDIAYDGSFYGYSPGSHPEAKILVRYLALVFGSRFAVWWSLMTSGEFGAERHVVEKMTLERMPIPDFDTFDNTTLKELCSLFDDLMNNTRTWSDVDDWVADLYGLSDREVQTIDDTLNFNLPYSANQQYAEENPSPAMRADFCNVLREELLPWCRRFDTEIIVRQVTVPALSPWHCIEIFTGGNRQALSVSDDEVLTILRAADVMAANEMDMLPDSDCLLHARLAQARHWTKTRARLYAQHIIWTHPDLLKSRKSV